MSKDYLLRIAGAAAASFLAFCGAYILLLFLMGDLDNDFEVVAAVIVYSVATTLGILSSSCFTFLMLRAAGYRFAASDHA